MPLNEFEQAFYEWYNQEADVKNHTPGFLLPIFKAGWDAARKGDS